MKVSAQTIAALEDVFKGDGDDPAHMVARVQAVALLHGAEATLSALAQIHMVTAAHLSFLRRRDALAQGQHHDP